MSFETLSRLRAAAMILGPVALLAAFLYHPFVSDLTNLAQLGPAAESDPVHWAWAHIALGLGFGLLLIGAVAARRYLEERGDRAWSFFGLPLVILGTMLAMLHVGGEGLGQVWASQAQADTVAIGRASESWVGPLHYVSAALMGAGWVAIGVGAFRVMGSQRYRSIVSLLGFTVAAAAGPVPSSWASYIASAALLVGMAPIALDVLADAKLRQIEVHHATDSRGTGRRDRPAA